jgi:DNA repair/transcription protein MET18/MMS19
LVDLLVTVVHFLIFSQKSFDNPDNLFHAIFDENGVQAYVQADREKLLEIFEFFVKNHFHVIEKAGVQFYTIFANAAGGERDPRCLMKVFSIFVHVMERMDLGVLMEEMFELVACYYPIEYQPVCYFKCTP